MDTQQKINALMHRMKARLDRFNKSQKVDRLELLGLEQLQRRERIAQLINVPGAVQTRSQFPVGHKADKLAGLVGTLREIRRTRCIVEFDGAGRWDFAIGDIVPSEVQR